MLCLGKSVHSGNPVELTLNERRQGTYIIGTTGTGKSTLLKNIIRHDLENDPDHGLCVLDPHGDLIDELLLLVPENRKQDVVLFNPMDMERPFGLNLLAREEENDPLEERWVISTVMGTLGRMFSHSWGPQLEHVLRSTLVTAMQEPDSTFIEMLLLLTNQTYQKKFLEKIDDPFLITFWKDFPREYKKRMDLTASTINKLSPFLTDRTMRNIIGQPKNTLKMKDIMDEGQILFVNLSKGDLGEENSSLLGSILVNLILIAALKRRDDAKDKRKAFHLIVDEFQNFATESFAVLQSEARKYGVDVVVAHQFRDQLDLEIKGSTLNVGNLVVFRTTGKDSYDLASMFDNTPPPPEKRVEAAYSYFDYQGQEFLVETELSTGEGKLYQEVDERARPYNDVEAQMANQLSILPDYQAWCRLIQKRETKEKNRIVPRLVEYQFEVHDIDRELKNEPEEKKAKRREIAEYIKENSIKDAPYRADVEEDIERRSHGEIRPGEDGGPKVLPYEVTED